MAALCFVYLALWSGVWSFLFVWLFYVCLPGFECRGFRVIVLLCFDGLIYGIYGKVWHSVKRVGPCRSFTFE